MKKTVTLFLILIFAIPSLFAEKVEIDVTLSNPVLLDSGAQRNYIRVGLVGFEMQSEEERPPVNTAIVLDVSGSMSGQKMRQAQQAAHTAIDMLRDGDVVSLVSYSDYANLIYPATILDAYNRRNFHQAIDRLYADGSTALFAGVSMGGRELDTYLSSQRVNRVILLSDGLANVGPQTPWELGNLGEILSRRGISVSTIGLGSGYNADLMYELAARSDGNHAFVEHPQELVGIFEKEFESLMAVVAQDVEIRIDCGEGVRPLRIMNRNGDIVGNEAVIKLNQIYSRQEQYIILEVEMDPGADGEERDAADVSIDYLNMKSRSRDQFSDSVAVAFTKAEELVIEQQDRATLADVTMQIATETNEEAVRLRDEGKIEEAEELLRSNGLFLQQAAEEYDSDELLEYSYDNYDDASGVASPDWEDNKKEMRERQHSNRTQQIY